MNFRFSRDVLKIFPQFCQVSLTKVNASMKRNFTAQNASLVLDLISKEM